MQEFMFQIYNYSAKILPRPTENHQIFRENLGHILYEGTFNIPHFMPFVKVFLEGYESQLEWKPTYRGTRLRRCHRSSLPLRHSGSRCPRIRRCHTRTGS